MSYSEMLTSNEHLDAGSIYHDAYLMADLSEEILYVIPNEGTKPGVGY